MSEYSINVKITPPDALSPVKLDSAINRALKRSSLLIEGKAKDNLQDHVVTGRLRASITAQTVIGKKVKIVAGSNVNYAQYVEKGTKPHEIRPKNKKALAWQSGQSIGGRGNPLGPKGTATFTFAKVVHHPGTKPVHYMKKALDDSKSEIAKIFGDEIKRALTG